MLKGVLGLFLCPGVALPRQCDVRVQGDYCQCGVASRHQDQHGGRHWLFAPN